MVRFMKRLNIYFGVSLFVALMVVIFPQKIQAQECSMPIMVKVVNDNNLLTQADINDLTHRLERVVSKEGYGTEELAYLCLLAYVSENEKEIISGNRPIVAMETELHLIVGNAKSGEKYASTYLTMQGAGNKESQVYRKAFAHLNQHNSELVAFLKNAQKKVMEYYEGQIPAMVKQADLMTQRGEYEDALFMLSSIPPCCSGYEPVEESIIRIWTTYINRECSEQLAKAQAIWRTNKTQEGALAAAAYIAAINRESDCASAADELLSEIEAKLDEEYARALALEEDQKQYEREQVEKERELRHEKMNLKQKELEGIRDVALSFADSVLGQWSSILPLLLKND